MKDISPKLCFFWSVRRNFFFCLGLLFVVMKYISLNLCFFQLFRCWDKHFFFSQRFIKSKFLIFKGMVCIDDNLCLFICSGGETRILSLPRLVIFQYERHLTEHFQRYGRHWWPYPCQNQKPNHHRYHFQLWHFLIFAEQVDFEQPEKAAILFIHFQVKSFLVPLKPMQTVFTSLSLPVIRV